MTANPRLLNRCPGRLYIFVSDCSWVYPPVLASPAIEARPAVSGNIAGGISSGDTV